MHARHQFQNTRWQGIFQLAGSSITLKRHGNRVEWYVCDDDDDDDAKVVWFDSLMQKSKEIYQIRHK